MRSVLPALALLLALPLVAFDAPVAPSPDHAAVATSHTVEIEYASTDGDLRNATLRITRRGDARPAWRGAIKQIAVHGPDGWILIESVRRIEGGVEARARIPGPSGVYAFAILTDEGLSRVWTNPALPPAPKPTAESQSCPGLRCMELIDPWNCTCSDPNPWPERDDDDEEETEDSEDTGGKDKDQFMSFGI